MTALESTKEPPMSSVEIDASLIRALQARARKETTTVDRLARRLIAESLQQLADHETVKAFREEIERLRHRRGKIPSEDQLELLPDTPKPRRGKGS